MLKWVLIVGVLLLIPALLIFKTGVTPRPVPVIDISRIDNPAQAGVLAYRVLRHELQQYAVIILGLTAPADQIPAAMTELPAGFLRAAESQGEALAMIDGPRWAEAKQAVLHGHRVVITLPTGRLFGPARQAVLAEARRVLGVEPLIVAVAPVDGRACGPGRSLHFAYDDTSFLPCAAGYMAHKTARKKAITAHSAMALEQFGRDLFLLFLWHGD
jgi:hypothetical protein